MCGRVKDNVENEKLARGEKCTFAHVATVN